MTARLTFVGHSTVLLELGGTRLLTDPVLGERVLHIQRRVPLPEAEHLDNLDGILISHAHADHLDLRSLRQVAGGCPVVAPRGTAGIIRRARPASVIEVVEGDRHEIGGVGITAVAADHDGKRQPLGREIDALGYLIDGPPRIYFAGDTDLFDEMAELAGRVDVALLPIWGWGPRVPEGHMDPRLAAQAVALIRPAVAVPIHWGTLRVIGAQRKLDPREPAELFASEVAALGVETEVRILAPGESLDL